MKIAYTERHHIHHARTELKDGVVIPCRETPSRLDIILATLKEHRFGEFIKVSDDPSNVLAKIHAPDYLEFLKNVWPRWCAFKGSDEPVEALPFACPARQERDCPPPASISGQLGYYGTDIGSPIMAGTWEGVFAGAACALTAQKTVTAGAPAAFSLSRPPGHHAYRDAFGGYCFLNNAAVAAEGFLLDGAARIAILDVDYHHGNGTQSIFYDRNDILFLSIHADPDFEYPFFAGHADQTGSGPGEGANRNYPLGKGTDWVTYRQAVEAACAEIDKFAPDALVLSLGADIYRGDPLSTFLIETEDFARLGEMLGHLQRPTAIIQEGGYAIEALGNNIHAFLSGFTNAHRL